MGRPRNIIGPRVRKLREDRKLTQPNLVARCNLMGWGLSRESLAKIEAQIRWVADFELVALAKVLGVQPEELLPSGDRMKLVKPFLKGL